MCIYIYIYIYILCIDTFITPKKKKKVVEFFFLKKNLCLSIVIAGDDVNGNHMKIILSYNWGRTTMEWSEVLDSQGLFIDTSLHSFFI